MNSIWGSFFWDEPFANANDAFKVESGYNLKCNQAGTYRVTYSVSTDKLHFYTVA